MKILWIFLLLMGTLFAAEDKLIIDSNSFEANDGKGIAIFTGDVKMTRIQDKLNAQKVVVYLAPKENGKASTREPLKYVATGEVDFEVFTALKHYIGKGDKVIYIPNELKYEIIGNGFLKDVKEDKTLIGDTIYIDQKTGSATVKGSKDKPVRFILNIQNSSTPTNTKKPDANKSAETLKTVEEKAPVQDAKKVDEKSAEPINKPTIEPIKKESK